MDIYLEKIVLGMIIIFAVGIGWALNESWETYTNEQTLNGMWFKGYYNYSDVKAEAYKRDNSAEWVCTNLNKNMKIEDIYPTCIHECMHSAYSELFAEKCEKDYKFCEDLIKQETTK